MALPISYLIVHLSSLNEMVPPLTPYTNMTSCVTQFPYTSSTTETLTQPNELLYWILLV